MGHIGFFVTHAGNRYVVAPDMAEIFARKRERLVKADRGELVPLPHSGGVDILWVDARVPCEITPIVVSEGEDVESAKRRWGLSKRRYRASSSPTNSASAARPKRSTAL